MKRIILLNSLLVILCLLLSSWGEVGHSKINGTSTQFFPRKLKPLKSWTAQLAEHASDPDKMRRDDKYEATRHFIDIDIYSDFVKNHRIIENRDSAYLVYGRAMVTKTGTLPWVTDSTYRALVQNFKNKDWNRALLTAADLGHYVGDGHMPMHLTTNYDGKLTGQAGLHDRYESQMIKRYIGEINYKPSKVHEIKDVKSYIFHYIYADWNYLARILEADKQAYAAAGNEYSEVYYKELWNRTSEVTTLMLAQSSKSMAELIYTAWIEAGKPKLPKSENPGQPIAN